MTDTTQTTPREEWEKPFDNGVALKIGKAGKSEGVANVRREIKDFIRETRTAAYKEGLRDALEALPEVTKQPESEEGAHYEMAQKEYKYFAAEAIARLQD